MTRSQALKILGTDYRVERSPETQECRVYRVEPAEDPAGRDWKDWPHGSGRWNRSVLVGKGSDWESAVKAAGLKP